MPESELREIDLLRSQNLQLFSENYRLKLEQTDMKRLFAYLLRITGPITIPDTARLDDIEITARPDHVSHGTTFRLKETTRGFPHA